MNLAKAVLPRKALYVVLKSATSKVIFSVRKLLCMPNVTGRVIFPSSFEDDSGVILWKGCSEGFSLLLGIPITSRAPVKRRLIELPPSIKTRGTLIFLIVGSTTIGYHTGVVFMVG